MFATAAYFRVSSVHVHIESASPPRSALGGSSAAAVALIGACCRLRQLATGRKIPDLRQIALLAQAIEESVAGVPCGYQDQLAAAFGGVNAWQWLGDVRRAVYKRRRMDTDGYHRELMRHVLVAYCGRPHESRDINGQWVRQFLAGRYRALWTDIVQLTRKFVQAVSGLDFRQAAEVMNQETAIRSRMTPGVLDEMGRRLSASAAERGCGARFTGAGGGGCVWAIGESKQIRRLRSDWLRLLEHFPQAGLLDVGVDRSGLKIGRNA
jgi:D-glycero-alpha-D-manno-heptose-7-phosphate kinase